MSKLKGIIIAVILVCLIGGYYFYLSNVDKKEDDVVITAVQDVILRNLETNYPPSVKEVVKYYSEISKCLYNEEYTQEQLGQMADKLLALYDSELAENNPRDKYLITLKDEIKVFEKNQYTIVTYTPASSTEVEYYTVEGRECASINCAYSIKKGAEYVTSIQTFILRKDASTGRWKILGITVPQTTEEQQG